MHSEELFATEIPDGITRKLLGGTIASLLTRKVIKEKGLRIEQKISFGRI